MLKDNGRGTGSKLVLLLAVSCLAVSLGSAMAAESQSLTTSAETLAIGGSDCSDFMDGFAVGMGIAALFGCAWCVVGAVTAKGIALFC